MVVDDHVLEYLQLVLEDEALEESENAQELIDKIEEATRQAGIGLLRVE